LFARRLIHWPWFFVEAEAALSDSTDDMLISIRPVEAVMPPLVIGGIDGFSGH
jgi:hypothetical protein